MIGDAMLVLIRTNPNSPRVHVMPCYVVPTNPHSSSRNGTHPHAMATQLTSSSSLTLPLETSHLLLLLLLLGKEARPKGSGPAWATSVNAGLVCLLEVL